MKNRNLVVAVVCAIFAGMLFSSSLQAQETARLDRQYGQDMLRTVANAVRKHYYDPKFHGLNFDALVTEAKARIDKSPSLDYSMSVIAAMLDNFNDGQLFFFPPEHATILDPGWREDMVGNHYYIVNVCPGTDTAAKLKPGDEILAINGYQPTLDNYWKLEYLFWHLRPSPQVHLTVRNIDGTVHSLDVAAKQIKYSHVTDMADPNQNKNYHRINDANYHLYDYRTEELGDLMILKLPTFEYSQDEVDSMKHKALKHRLLIIDLRDVETGSLDTDGLEYLVGSFFDKDVKIADRIGRKDMKPLVAKSRGAFTGKLIVLVNSRSMADAELFARVIQLEKRGIIIGDHTRGSTMEAQFYFYNLGSNTTISYYLSITDANLIMADGKSLEHVGVTPDEVMLPTAADLAAGRDPVLAHAAQELGVKLSPEDAGKMFPYLWPLE